MEALQRQTVKSSILILSNGFDDRSWSMNNDVSVSWRNTPQNKSSDRQSECDRLKIYGFV